MEVVMISEDVVDYLKSKENLWRPDSIKTAASRLMHYQPNLDALAIYNNMSKAGYKPYYIKITFVSLSAFMDWRIAQGRATLNTFKTFMKQNNQLFRNAYQDKYATISWEDFIYEFKKADPEMQKVLALLGFGGCRLSEIRTYQNGKVYGKGGKFRNVYVPNDFNDICNVRINLSNDQIRRRLAHNPHSYRKLAADKWIRSGLDLKTVQVLLGHTSLVSTQRYLRPLEADTLKNKLEDMWRTA